MKKIFAFCIAVCFLFLVGAQFCFSQINYNAGLDFSNLGSEINLGKILHIRSATEHETQETPISWEIISNEDNDLYLVSKYALDYLQYSSANSSNWDNSDLKSWLDNTFIDKFGGIKESIKNLSLPYVEDDKVYIGEEVELTNLALDTKSGDAINVNWWTKTPRSGNIVKIIKYKNGSYSVGTMGADASLYVRPCMTLDLSKVIYFDSTNKKFSFVAGEAVGELGDIADSFEINSGENLTLDISQSEKPIAYKIIANDEIVSYGTTSENVIDTENLAVGNYDVYLWLQENGDTFNLTSEPKKFTLSVVEANPQINNVTFSRCGHRKNFERDITIDLSGKNFKANDEVTVEFIKDDVAKLSQSAKILSDADEFSFVLNAESLKKLSDDSYKLKLYLKRGSQTLIEKQLDFDYVVSDLPVISEMILSPASLNISTDKKQIDFSIKLDGLELNDEVVSGAAYVIFDGKEIAHTENVTKEHENYCGKIVLPDKIIPGDYEFDSRFKIKNEIMGDEYTITSSAVKFKVSQSKLNTPKASLESGRYFSAQTVNLTADDGAEIFYSLDGSIPNQNSNKFTMPIKLFNGNYILRAIAYKENYEPSDILQKNYEIVQSSSSGGSSADDEDEFEVKDENGVVEKLEYEISDDKIVLHPSMENILEMTDKNEFVNLNLDAKDNIDCSLDKNLVSYVANYLSGLKMSVKDVGDVTIKNDVFKNLLGHDLEIELGDFSLDIKSDGEDYVPYDFKNNIEVSFKYEADKKLDPDSIFLMRKHADKNEIVIQSCYDAKQKVVNLKTNMGGKFEVCYNDKKFADASEKEISFLVARKILNGVGQNEFLPDEKIKQADFLIMLMRSIGRSENIKHGEKYYSGYVEAAQKLNLLNDKNFEPEKALTSKQMYSMAQKFFDVGKMNLDDKFMSRMQAAKFMYELLTIDLGK